VAPDGLPTEGRLEHRLAAAFLVVVVLNTLLLHLVRRPRPRPKTPNGTLQVR